MMPLAQKVFSKYSLLGTILFFIFLLGVLSCGRAFSILHLNTPLAPVFITEIILLFCLPLIVFQAKAMYGFPKTLCFGLVAYFALGCIYLCGGLLQRNLFALRDMVLFIYMLFFPITFILVSDEKKMRWFLLMLGLANLIGLLVGRFLVLGGYPSEAVRSVIVSTKKFNLGLYYGISSAFLIAFWSDLKLKVAKLALLMLVSINLYMITLFGVRTVWLSVFVLLVLLSFILRKKMLMFVLCVAPVFFVLSASLFYFDFIVFKEYGNITRISGRTKSMLVFVKQSLPGPRGSAVNTKTQPAAGARRDLKTGLDNIIWRKEIWKQTIVFGLESPVWGRGFGVYPRHKIWEYVPPKGIGVDSRIIPAHNHLITVFYKMGFLGLGIFLFINAYIFSYGLAHIKKCADNFSRSFLIGALGAFAYWHLIAFGFDVIDSPPTSIFLWVLTGLIFAAVMADKRRQSAHQ